MQPSDVVRDVLFQGQGSHRHWRLCSLGPWKCLSSTHRLPGQELGDLPTHHQLLRIHLHSLLLVGSLPTPLLLCFVNTENIYSIVIETNEIHFNGMCDSKIVDTKVHVDDPSMTGGCLRQCLGYTPTTNWRRPNIRCCGLPA